MTVTLPLPEQLQDLIDLSTLHSEMQKKILNNPQQLEGLLLYYLVVVLMMWSADLCEQMLSVPWAASHFGTFFDCFIYFFSFVNFLKFKEKPIAPADGCYITDLLIFC